MSPACAGLTVVEVAVGSSDLGLGLAGSVPGFVLASLGAEVVRVVGTATPAIDDTVPWGTALHRDKRVVATDDAEQLRDLLRTADVVLVYGPSALVEERGFGYEDVAALNPSLIYARCEPSRSEEDEIADYALLAEARGGFYSQLAGHRDGPIFIDVQASGIGTASLLLTSVLALLRRRVLTGVGGWARTSLYDGMLATLGCMIGRSERAAPEIEYYWEHGSTFPNFLYHCADGELIQVWFGGKGMYAALIDVLGDEPSNEGYYADQMAGRLGERAAQWVKFFATQPRDVWIERLRAAGVACEPVLAPGEALLDPHLAEIGLAVQHDVAGSSAVMLGAPIAVEPTGAGEDAGQADGPGLLSGLRVADFSAYVAGPLAAQVLADLGADVIKIEPPEGEAMRAAAYAVAACQRGKRSIALDLASPQTRPIVERLIRDADVVLHNFRVGVAERLGIGAQDVAALNPNAVYCHASAFGASGPRATYPGNDALMQAVTGFERAVGGAANEPTAATWIPIDMAGGWVGAVGILAGLYARAAGQGAQRVSSSLLGAGMLLHGGVFWQDGELVRGPEVDAEQTGFGPGYRIYRCEDGEWLALVLPDADAWARLGAIIELPPQYAPLRGGPHDDAAHQAEVRLEWAFATAPAAEWVAQLRAADVLVEPVVVASRDEFRQSILDDETNRAVGRAITYETRDWGRFEQLGRLLRCGPDAEGGLRTSLPGVGEQSTEVLTELGFTAEEIDAFLSSKVVRQLG